MVDIPKDWKIWPATSIRNLTKAPATPDIYGRKQDKDATFIPVEPEKEVELILDKRRNQGRTEYFVKWKDLPLPRCTWLPETDLEDARGLVDEFEDAKQGKTLGKHKRMREAEQTEGTEMK